MMLTCTNTNCDMHCFTVSITTVIITKGINNKRKRQWGKGELKIVPAQRCELQLVGGLRFFL